MNKICKALNITEQQFNEIMRYAFSTHTDNIVDVIGFESNDVWITNPFIDDTGRFDLTVDESILTYGEDNIYKYCKEVLQKINSKQ